MLYSASIAGETSIESLAFLSTSSDTYRRLQAEMRHHSSVVQKPSAECTCQWSVLMHILLDRCAMACDTMYLYMHGHALKQPQGEAGVTDQGMSTL